MLRHCYLQTAILRAKSIIEKKTSIHKSSEKNAEIVLREECSQKHSYLSRYVESLGESKVTQLIQNQIDDIDYIQHSVYTEGEGVTYNAIVWKKQ